MPTILQNPGHGGSKLLRDVVAGTSVALILLPQSLAYADLAGMPAHHGLYAAALPPLAAAFFASSPYLQTGPVALTSLLTLGALLPLATPATPEYVGLAAVLAVIVGLSRAVLGLARMGVIAYLMSEPVLQGFTSAAGILIVASQLPAALGVAELPVSSVMPGAVWAAAHPGSWETTSIVLTVVTILLIRGGRRLHPMLPGVLVATVAAIVFSVLTDYTGPRIGTVPEGLPPFTLGLPWGSMPSLILPGIVIAVIGFAEPASIARTFAAQERQPWDPDRELLGQGVANLAAGITGGFPVGGSFSRSMVNRMAGARTRWSGAVAGLVVLAFLPFADLMAPLPRAVLSAIVIAAVFGLIQLRSLGRLWSLSRPQALVAWTTFALTLGLAPHIEQAVILGVLIAMSVHLWRELPLGSRSWTEGRTLHLEFKGVLWFGSAPAIEKAFLYFVQHRDELDRLVVHLGGLGRIDLTGALILRKLVEDAREGRVEVQVQDVPPHAHRILASVLDWEPGEDVVHEGEP